MRDERLARQWAERVAAHEWNTAEKQAAAEYILATTTPTMADIEWDDAKHTFAGATVMFGDGLAEVVMLSESDDEFIDFALLDGRVGNQYKGRLTPNGKKYELREVGATVSSDENVADKQAGLGHPKYLETLANYENAPEGTVVADLGGNAWTKDPSGEWLQGEGWITNLEMAGTRRDVLRWRWGK